jgi:hypothetical protein
MRAHAVLSIGSTNRATWFEFPPDLDVAVLVGRLPMPEVLDQFQHDLSKSLCERAGRDGRTKWTISFSEVLGQLHQYVGPSTHLIDLHASTVASAGTTILRYPAQIQVAIQTVAANVRYEAEFARAIQIVPASERGDILAEIRWLKRALNQAGIYGSRHGMPGHLVEQLVLQHRRPALPRPLDGLMTALAALPLGDDNKPFESLPPVVHPGYAERPSMWKYITRTSPADMNSIIAQLRQVGAGYLKLVAEGVV